MPELAPPLSRLSRECARLEVIEELHRQKNWIDSQLRLQMSALVNEDIEFGFRTFTADVLALHLKESPGTAERWLESAQMYAAYPVVVAQVASGQWSLRHADALLDAVVGLGLSEQVQAKVVELVVSHTGARTPYQVKKAAHAALMVLDPEAARKRFEKAKKDRGIGVDHSGDGVGRLWANGTVTQVAMLDAALSALAGPKQPGDDRTLTQRKFDALMDLVCGRRVATGGWEVQLLMDLETVTGGDLPAEIPGLGLVCAEEAREVLPQAALRRMVVDEHGKLVVVDGKVYRPDLDEPPTLRSERLPSSDVEPELRLLLEDALALAGSCATAKVVRYPGGIRVVELDYRHGGPADGGGEPKAPPDEPAPPSFDDLAWHDETVDRAALDALLRESPRVLEDTPGGPPPRPPPRWSLAGLERALRSMARAPADLRPLESSGYQPSGRLARHIKARDQSCTFPSCRRLARDCEMDHVKRYPQGSTCERNLASDCTHHHQAKHAVFTVVRTHDGTVHWTTRAGLTVSRPLRPLIRGW